MNRIICLLLAATIASTALAASDESDATILFGQHYAIAVSDPAAFVEALQQYRDSETGRRASATVAVAESVANGDDPATHYVTVTYPSADAMGADLARAAESEDWAEFVSSFSEVARVEEDSVFTMTHSVVNDENFPGEGVVTLLYVIDTSRPDRYVAAMEELMEAGAAQDFPGNTYAGQIVARGGLPGDLWVSFQAADLASLLRGVGTLMSSQEFDTFTEEVGDIREIVGRYLTRTMLELAPAEN